MTNVERKKPLFDINLFIPCSPHKPFSLTECPTYYRVSIIWEKYCCEGTVTTINYGPTQLKLTGLKGSHY